jgi:hypothetical protein
VTGQLNSGATSFHVQELLDGPWVPKAILEASIFNLPNDPELLITLY